MSKLFLTTEQAAEIAGIHPAHFNKVYDGPTMKMPGRKTQSKKSFILRTALEEWMQTYTFMRSKANGGRKERNDTRT